MVKQAAPTPRRACYRPALALFIVILVVCALTPVSALAAQGGAPFIESIGSDHGAEITISAKINPEGLETSYEIGSVGQWKKGTLPAVHESIEVGLALAGLQAGRRYGFEVRARNVDGEVSQHGETIEMPEPLPSFPDGASGVGVVTNPPPEAMLNELRAIGIREEERRTKQREEQEQKARELSARPASELERTEEPPACVVPAMKGDTLTVARRVLAKAHCRVGAIRRPTHHHGTLYVSAQGVHPGAHLSYGARIMLRVDAKRRAAKRAPHRR